MHDPMTVAFEIKRPWPARRKSLDPPGWKYYPSLVTIWHRDPERRGDDDSCRWFVPGRPWWKHPRWHFHHWRIRVALLLYLKRWIFSRCAGCGKRFPWGYAPISMSWNGHGPRWFRGETNTYHHGCDPPCRKASS